MKHKWNRRIIGSIVVIALAAYTVVSLINLNQIVAAEEYFGLQSYGPVPLVSISNSEIVVEIRERDFTMTKKSFVINNRTRFFDENKNLVDNLRSNGEINRDALLEFLKPGRKVIIEVMKIEGKEVTTKVEKMRVGGL